MCARRTVCLCTPGCVHVCVCVTCMHKPSFLVFLDSSPPRQATMASSMAAFALRGESGYLSPWSLVHTSVGLSWNWAWHAAFDQGGVKLNLFFLVLVAIVFELIENNMALMGPLWRRLGRGLDEFGIDSVSNSQTDVLVAVLGHGMSELFFETLSRTAASVATLVIVGILASTFVIYFVTVGYKRWGPPSIDGRDGRPLVVRVPES